MYFLKNVEKIENKNFSQLKIYLNYNSALKVGTLNI